MRKANKAMHPSRRSAVNLNHSFWRRLGDRRRSCLASDFVVLVLSEAVLSETVLVLDGCLNCGNSDR
jgi:hypothetical protein